LESDAPAEGDGSAAGLDGGRLELVEDDEVDFVDAGWSEGNLARESGDRRRVTTLDFGCFMVDFEVEVGGRVVMVDDIAMCYCRGVEVAGEQPRLVGRGVGGVALTGRDDLCRGGIIAPVVGVRGGCNSKGRWQAHGGRWRWG